ICRRRVSLLTPDLVAGDAAERRRAPIQLHVLTRRVGRRHLRAAGRADDTARQTERRGTSNSSRDVVVEFLRLRAGAGVREIARPEIAEVPVREFRFVAPRGDLIEPDVGPVVVALEGAVDDPDAIRRSVEVRVLLERGVDETVAVPVDRRRSAWRE